MPLPSSSNPYTYVLPPEQLRNSNSVENSIFDRDDDLKVSIEIWSLLGTNSCVTIEIKDSVDFSLSAINLDDFADYRFPTFCLRNVAFYHRDNYQSAKYPNNPKL